MNRKVTVLFVLFWLIQGMSVCGARMPRGAFLVEPASSAWQLAQQVSHIPKVGARYQKHFGVSPEQFAVYARTQLGVRPLKNGGNYRVYYIKSDGTIGSAIRRLRKGTLVFMHLATGTPVLLAECGNPMDTHLPGFAPAGAQNTAPVQSSTQTTVQPLPAAEVTLAPDVLETPLLPVAESAPLEPWMADPSLLMPDIPLSSQNVLAHAVPASLVPLFAAGLGMSLQGGGSPSGRGGSAPPVVPEPTTVMLWLGAGPALWWIRRRRRQATS